MKHKSFENAEETLKYLVEKCLKKGGSDSPLLLTFDPGPLNMQVGDFNITSQRWSKLLRDYVRPDIIPFIEGGLPKKGSKSYMANLTTLHTKGNCFLGFSLTPKRITMFSRRSKICPTGAMDIWLLSRMGEKLGVSCNWYLDTFYCDPLFTIVPLLKWGWDMDDIKSYLSPSQLKILSSMEKGNSSFNWKQYERVALALNFKNDPQFKKPEGVSVEDIAKYYKIPGVKIRNLIRAEFSHLKPPYIFKSLSDKKLTELLKRAKIPIPEIEEDQLSKNRDPRNRREVDFSELKIERSIWNENK